jgi:hypothetical protein
MALGPRNRRSDAAALKLLDVDVEAKDDSDSVTKCGRCGRSFLHPSTGSGDPPKWWVCPSCRSHSAGATSGTDSPRETDAWR